MQKYFCDLCKKEVNNTWQLDSFFTQVVMVTSDKKNFMIHGQLCNDCRGKLAKEHDIASDKYIDHMNSFYESMKKLHS